MSSRDDNLLDTIIYYVGIVRIARRHRLGIMSFTTSITAEETPDGSRSELLRSALLSAD